MMQKQLPSEHAEPLTHEELNKQFKSNFDLVNSAIKLASTMVSHRINHPSEDAGHDLNIVNDILKALSKEDDELEPTVTSSVTEL